MQAPTLINGCAHGINENIGKMQAYKHNPQNPSIPTTWKGFK